MTIKSGCNNKAVIVFSENGDSTLFSYDTEVAQKIEDQEPKIYPYARESDFTNTTRRHINWFLEVIGLSDKTSSKKMIDNFRKGKI